MQEYGACPVTKESLSVEDLVPIKINKVNKSLVSDLISIRM